ncbi:MAG: tetratricopeptide repeat protein [Aeoliella sp.]
MATQSTLSKVDWTDDSYPGKKFRTGFENLKRHFEQAVEQDPDHAPHHVGLANARIMLWCFGFVPHSDAMVAAESDVATAIELDNRYAPAHTAAGVVRLGKWDWSGAEKHFERAIEIDPQNAESRHWHALYLSALGRHDQARAESLKALELDPSSGYQTGFGAILYFARDFERMCARMESTIADAPDFAPGYDWLGMAYVQEGRYTESIAVYEKAVKLSGNLAEIKAGLGHAYAVAGNDAEARAISRELASLSQRWHVPPVQRAFVHVGLGENDLALGLLEQAFRERSWELVFLQVEPWLDDLRGEAQFDDLARRIGFPE